MLGSRHDDAATLAIAQQIRERVDALLTLSSMGGTLTATGAEQDLYVSDEPLGCHYNRTLYVDLDNMLGGDTTVFRTYYRLEDAGGWLQTDYQACVGADGGLANGNVALAIALGPNRHGVKVTLQQTAGVNRAYTWEVFAEL